MNMYSDAVREQGEIICKLFWTDIRGREGR